MKRIYGKTTKELIKEFVLEKKKSGINEFQRNDIRNWFKKNYPNIKRGTIDAHLTLLTVNASSRIHYNVHSDGSDDLFIQKDDGTLILYDSEKSNLKPIYKSYDQKTYVDDELNNSISTEFAYEEDLKNYLAKNLNILESGLVLYEDDGVTGIEFDAGGRFLDILAIDKNNNYVVIELKVSKGYDRVIGQLLRYMGWIEQNLCDSNQKVRGIIVARNISEDLKIACKKIKEVLLFEYNLNISVKKIE